MRSTIKFDLTEKNAPSIVIDRDRTSEDLRDKVAQRFIEGLGYDSNWLRIESIIDTNKYIITPINGKDLLDLAFNIMFRYSQKSRNSNEEQICNDIMRLIGKLNRNEIYNNSTVTVNTALENFIISTTEAGFKLK